MRYVVNKRTIVIALGAILALTAAMSLLGMSLSRMASATAGCVNSLAASEFEIDPNANLVVNNTTLPCIDWLDSTVAADTEAKADKPTGATDDSFGQGTAEDNPNPTIVDGSIPPQKSDLKAFGVYEEGEEAIELFWTRVQDPQGTTNMDFELNQLVCTPNTANPSSDPDCAENGTRKAPNHVTPKRTDGDVLITYDLSKGGTVPTISIRFWDGTALEWGDASVISDPGNPNADAVGSINTTGLTAAQTGTVGGVTLGALSPFTFGEVSVSFDALFGEGACGEFGSAYLKSRSSDSFTAEIKDFVEPEEVSIGNCPSALTTEASADVNVGGTLTDTATLDVPEGTNGTITFNLYGPLTPPIGEDDCVTSIYTEDVAVTDFDPASPEYTTATGFAPTAPGTYNWTASFDSDTPTVDDFPETGCGVTVEQADVNQAQSSVSTVQTFIPQDAATVSSGPAGTPLGTGTVEFKLFSSLTACQANTVTPLYTETVNVTGNSPQTVSTNNDGDPTDAGPPEDAIAGYTVTGTGGDLFWRVTYSGNGTSIAGSSSACVEDSSVTIDNTTEPTTPPA